MNAYLMAAGVATRLRPVTEKYPKCLLMVNETEMLDYWLTACLHSKIFNNIFVNVHHCSDIVYDWIKKYKKRISRIFGSESAAKIKIIDETSALLGTAGTLYWHGDPDKDFFLAYVDTYSHAVFNDLWKMVKNWHDNPENPLAGLLTFNLPNDGSAGVIESDFMGTINSFSEKKGTGLSGWAGMMFARGDFINEIRQEDKDLGRDVFPRLCGKIRVLAHIDAYDIGRGIDEYEHFTKVR